MKISGNHGSSNHIADHIELSMAAASAAGAASAPDEDVLTPPRPPSVSEQVMQGGLDLFFDKLSGNTDNPHRWQDVAPDPKNQLVAGGAYNLGILRATNLRLLVKFAGNVLLNRALTIRCSSADAAPDHGVQLREAL